MCPGLVQSPGQRRMTHPPRRRSRVYREGPAGSWSFPSRLARPQSGRFAVQPVPCDLHPHASPHLRQGLCRQQRLSWQSASQPRARALLTRLEVAPTDPSEPRRPCGEGRTVRPVYACRAPLTLAARDGMALRAGQVRDVSSGGAAGPFPIRTTRPADSGSATMTCRRFQSVAGAAFAAHVRGLEPGDLETVEVMALRRALAEAERASA